MLASRAALNPRDPDSVLFLFLAVCTIAFAVSAFGCGKGPLPTVAPPATSEAKGAPVVEKRSATGVVGTVSVDFDTFLGTRKDDQGHLVLTLKTDRGIDVVCLFEPGAKVPAVEAGDRVEVRGDLDEETPFTLHLSKCEIVSHHPRGN
jgi:hypothetical protein